MSKDDLNNSEENPYLHNPLLGVGLKALLEEIVSYYGFDILHAYLNIQCFKKNPSIASSVKFLKKTDWAREKVELFYMYQYKNLPAVSSEQFHLRPRERIVPADQTPGEPAVLSVEEGLQLQKKQKEKAATRHSRMGERKGSREAYSEKRNTGGHQSNDKPRSKPVDDSGGDEAQSVKSPWANFKPKE